MSKTLITQWLHWGKHTIPILENNLLAQGHEQTSHNTWTKEATPQTLLNKLTAHERQREMSNKDDDGPLDGLLSPEGKWISETGPLHELIKSNLEHMYQPFWFPSLMSNILWKKIPNTNPQRHNMHNKPTTTHKRDLAISNLGLLINTLEQLLDILNSNSTTQTQKKNIAQKTRNLTNKLHLPLPPHIETLLYSLQTNTNKTITTEDEEWIVQRHKEGQHIKFILEKYTLSAWEKLEQQEPNTETTDAIKSIFQHISTPKEAAQMFKEMKSGTVSGPQGDTRDHYLNMPDHLLKALIPIINDMLDGNFPDITKIGALSPKAKNHTRIRPLHLLATLYRAVDGRVARRLTQKLKVLKITDEAQFGSIKGGSSIDPIDHLQMVAEDAAYHNKEAFGIFLDCSEAFDSLNNQVTDIVFQSVGLPEQIILWALRAKENQIRMISTAGGMSELTNPLIVQGGCQGSATMSPFWAIATTPMLKLATSIGGKGYKFTGIPKLLQKLGYVDDNAVLANRILEGAETAQVLIIMQAIMKIRVQGAKSNTIISQATHTKIMKEVENWYKQNSSPPETQLYTGIKGRAWQKTKRPLGKRNIPETPETPGTSHDMIVDTLLERNTLQNPREPWGFTFNNKFTIQTLKRNSTAEKKA